MRKFKYLTLMILSVFLLNSCFEESEFDLNADGYNVAGFEATTQNVAKVADGEEYPIEVKMKVKGPTSMDLTGSVTATVAAHDSSTAIEGTHYRIDEPEITLSADNDFLGLFTFTLLTAGIETPLKKSPVLILEVTDATGNEMVVNSGKLIKITLNYACFSDLAGNYSVTVLRDGGAITPYNSTVVTETGVGEYRTSEVGHWPASSLGGTPGFTFYDVCDVITIPGQNLVDLYSNWVNQDGLLPGSHDPETGIIEVSYKITSTWESVYDWTMVPAK
ncbi:MAG: hypothetical protein K9G38_01370 [Bacteroidales bacterium]|nr:hypothetical protein [Bacteroidales bacterium]